MTTGVSAITVAIGARAYVWGQLKLRGMKSVLTLQPSVLSSRATLVAGIGAAIALSALASLSPAPPPDVSAAQTPRVRAPLAAPVAYEPLVISRADSFIR
jgi:hypothetical protein